jgi:hypothetical protein
MASLKYIEKNKLILTMLWYMTNLLLQLRNNKKLQKLRN